MFSLLNLTVVFFLLFPFFKSGSCIIAQEDTFEVNEIHFQSYNVTFSGQFFVPIKDGKFPAVVILHGGSSNVKAHRSTSTYYARKFVINGIAETHKQKHPRLILFSL